MFEFAFDINIDLNINVSIEIRNRLTQARSEVRSLIQELQLIEAGLRVDFNGIGQEMCANAIRTVAEHYQNEVLSRLDGMENNWPTKFATGITNKS